MKYSVSDWQSKSGKVPDMRTTVMTADERCAIWLHHRQAQLAKGSDYKPMSFEVEERERQMRESAERSLERHFHRPMHVLLGMKNPPVEGVLAGHEWNKFVKEAWQSGENIIFHTVLGPEGKPLDKDALEYAKVRSRHSYAWEPPATEDGSYVLPDTITRPTEEAFEAFVETDCIKPERLIPNHFLVAKGETLALPQTRQVEAESRKQLPDTIFYRQAKKYQADVTPTDVDAA